MSARAAQHGPVSALLPGRVAVIVAVAACGLTIAAPPASAFNPLKPLCGAAGLASGLAGKACGAVQHAGSVLKAGKKLLSGHPVGAVKTIVGTGAGAVSSAGSAAAAAVGLAAVGAWVLTGAKFALEQTGKVLGKTTSPQLRSTWFSSAYWRMAAIAAVLTLPFLFAAAIQALVRSDIGLLLRAALGYLPLALIAVGIAAPLTMMLLAVTDQLSAVAAATGGQAGTHFLARAGIAVGVLSFFRGSPFLAFLVGLLAASGAIVLWLELLMREAAVYIVVLMLPLAFAALVWPARRVWAIRVTELLIALILSKFVIVAVLALGAAALGQGGPGGVTGAMAGAVLVLLGAFAPWALLRLLPLAELASGAAGALRGESWRWRGAIDGADELASGAADWVQATTAGMRQEAGGGLHCPGRAGRWGRGRQAGRAGGWASRPRWDRGWRRAARGRAGGAGRRTGATRGRAGAAGRRTGATRGRAGAAGTSGAQRRAAAGHVQPLAAGGPVVASADAGAR
ncbi:MAG: hypothetical protein JO206_10730 [Solirubrobacterales bacterium]|nr:hypothetical protein [Solirubrobacterales bacterium]